VGARTGEVPYGTRVAFEAGELVQQVELVLSDPTSNATGVAVGEVVLRVVRGCTHLRVRHAHTLRNDGDLVVHVPREARDGREPLIEVELPDDAVGFEASMGSGDGVEREGSLVRFWGPLHPGTQQIEFGYGVPLTHDAGSVQVGLPGGAPAVTVLVPQGDARLTTTSAAIRTDVDVSLDGRLYEVTEFGPVDAAGRVSFDVSLRTPDSPPLQTPAARLWLEVDDAAVDVSEQHQIEVEGTAPLTSPSGAPLLCIPLPADAEDLRFGSDTLEWGLSRDPSGALAVSGPIPPGESQLSMRYRIPVASDPVAFERSFSTRVPLLSIFVEDTGIVPITTRLHRRRPIRSEDRSYLHLEGFAIEPGENVTLRIQQLRRRGATSGLTAAGFVGLAALLAIVFLTGPLRSEPRRAPAPEAAQSVEREAVYRAVEALDEDFETGKLSPDDHARMRAELRARRPAPGRAQRGRPAARRRPGLPRLWRSAAGHGSLLLAVWLTPRGPPAGGRNGRGVSGAVIAARGLEKRFGRAAALRGIDFEVAQGESLAVLGPNGAGKSTLLRLVAGLSRPSAGTLHVADLPATRREARARVGYVGHATLLYPTLTARENLIFAGRLHGVPEPEARADSLLDEEGLSGVAHRPAGDFSRGMAQRLSIARGLAHDPEIVLLDEPFTGLDRRSADRLAARLALLHQEGRTVVVVTHDLPRALHVAGRAIVLSSGRLALATEGSGPEQAARLERATLEAADALR
jgi:heme ABC exporter ATP-binding subunit CcmA